MIARRLELAYVADIITSGTRVTIFAE